VIFNCDSGVERGRLAAAIVVCAVLAFLAVPMAATAAVTTWYFDDSGVVGWGQNGWANPPQWEWMDAGPLNGTLPYYDLDPVNPYYGCTSSLTGDFSGFRFWADIWFANNYPGANGITVELRRGGWYNQGTLIASASATVTNTMPTVNLYTFNFGVIPTLVLNNESLVVKIIYSGPVGDTHIYWDLPNYPSALNADSEVPVDPATWGKIKALYE
jgi:hypothetical protein